MLLVGFGLVLIAVMVLFSGNASAVFTASYDQPTIAYNSGSLKWRATGGGTVFTATNIYAVDMNGTFQFDVTADISGYVNFTSNVWNRYIEIFAGTGVISPVVPSGGGGGYVPPELTLPEEPPLPAPSWFDAIGDTGKILLLFFAGLIFFVIIAKKRKEEEHQPTEEKQQPTIVIVKKEQKASKKLSLEERVNRMKRKRKTRDGKRNKK